MPMAEFPEICVIRHGQTEWNLAGRYQGQMDSPLTALGREQARSLGPVLADLPGIAAFTAYTSPLGRAHATAALTLAATGHKAHMDSRLREVAFGAWEGLSWDDIAQRWPERAQMAEAEPFLWHFQAPGGETLADVTTRARAFLHSLSGPSILITHGVTGKVLRGLWLGLDEYDIAGLPGGQGTIFHLAPGQGERVLRPKNQA